MGAQENCLNETVLFSPPKTHVKINVSENIHNLALKISDYLDLRIKLVDNWVLM